MNLPFPLRIALALVLTLTPALAAPAPAAAQAAAVAEAAETAQVAPPQAADTARRGVPLARPTPAPVVPPPFFRQALERGTRSPDGSPGPAYWQNTADYDIDASLDPATGEVEGRARIVYRNRSPHTLERIVLHLHQNLHAEGVVRNEPQEVTGGVRLHSLAVQGRELAEGDPGAGPAYRVDGTILTLRPPEPVEPGGTAELDVRWSFTMPQSGAGRMGHSEREVYFVAYWFPKVAVFDDLRGWDAEPYMGTGEFYDPFDDYRVRLTMPEGWTVMATGELENPEEVWTERTRARLGAASMADSVVRVATAADLEAGRVTRSGADGRLTWRFSAERVRDFTWTASNVQRWDATSARVPDRDGDGAEDRVLIHAFWRPDRAPLWSEQPKYAKHAIEFHSRYTGIPYPWPHMTSVEGADVIGGGMEFPMLTIIGDYTERGPHDLYNVTSHEVAHMWIPMIMGTNEKRWAWIDEGATVFLENQGRPEYWPGDEADRVEAEGYLSAARAEAEQPLMRHADFYEPGPGFGVASYPKSATILVTLRNLLGADVFEEAYRTFLDEWAYRHPTPWDLFNTFERAAGTDLDWFWTTWYYETWTLDLAVGGVEEGPEGTTVVIEDRGWAPMPARVHVTTASGEEIVREIPVTHWLRGHTRARVEIPASAGTVTLVEVDPFGLWPDVDRDDNLWVR